MKDRVRSDCCVAGAARRRDTVEVLGALFKSADHAAHRLAEQHLDQLLHQARLEFEIDIEIDPTAAWRLLEHPVVVEAPEWALGVGYVDPPRRIERDTRSKALTKHAEADDQSEDAEIGAAV